MTPEGQEPPTATHSLWTIARIQNTLTNQVLIRRFLHDLTHAPAHEVMTVFTAWQHVAATIEAHAEQREAPDTIPDHPPAQARATE
jgi:hypothetical protein